MTLDNAAAANPPVVDFHARSAQSSLGALMPREKASEAAKLLVDSPFMVPTVFRSRHRGDRSFVSPSS